MKDYFSAFGIAYEAVDGDAIKSNLALPLDVVQPKPLVQRMMSMPFPRQLVGQKWNDYSLAVISGYRPQAIRVTRGEVTTHAPLNRLITIYVDANNVITGGRFDNIKTQVDVPQWMIEDQLAWDTFCSLWNPAEDRDE